MFDVISMGELLVDFTYSGRSADGMRLFEQNPGGAVANVACALANLGLKAAFVGKVGDDMHGDFLRGVLVEKGVDVSGLIKASDAFTTLAFVELAENGERSFSFARKPGADTYISPDDLNEKQLKSCGIFHFGSLSLTDEPARSATIKAINIAKSAGAKISYDPNYRAPLWNGREEAIKHMRSVLDKVDVIKISDEETELITGFADKERAAEELRGHGISCVVVTLGKNGAYASTKNGHALVPVPESRVVDTTGAGDAFWGGFLYKLSRSGLDPSLLNTAQLADFTEFANAVATLCVGRRGAIPALPKLAEVEEFLNSNLH